MNTDEIPCNDSTDSGSIAGQHVKKVGNNVGEHEGGLSSAEKAIPKRFSRLFRKVRKLASLCLITALAIIALSMLAPFYPQEAQARGVSTSVVGLIFGTYALTGFFVAPICGIMISKYGSISVLCVGTLLCGTALILFGFCAWVSNATAFVVFSFLLRAVGAFGGVACETSCMSIAIKEFPERLAMASTSVGVGFSVGPVLGGGLYTVGGFALPFFVIGCSTIVVIPVSVCCAFTSDHEFQSIKSASRGDQDDGLAAIGKALKIPAVWMIAVCLATSGLVQVFFEPILGPHLEKTMNLNSAQIGLVFLVPAITFAIVSPLAGWVGDKTHCYRWFTVAGYTGVGFGLFLLGPAPFLTFFLPSKRVWLVCVAMTVIGFSLGIYFAQLMPDLVVITRDKGMPDNSATRGTISSIFSGMINLGSTIGPILAGFFDQHIGFQWAVVALGIISFLQALVLLALTLFEKTTDSRTKEQYCPMMDNSSEGEEE